ncbi:hypothetical protein TNCV_1768541 [Trichonephila clavipes]|nr:hypothetical protein TNCV_1768541 [Trichonephila clavipes]
MLLPDASELIDEDKGNENEVNTGIFLLTGYHSNTYECDYWLDAEDGSQVKNDKSKKPLPRIEILFTLFGQWNLIKLALRNLQISKLNERNRVKPRNTTILNLLDYPSYRAVAVFLMTTVLNCLYAHLYQLKVANNLLAPMLRQPADDCGPPPSLPILEESFYLFLLLEG